MKILLDENLPKNLKKDLAEHEVFTVREKGWQGKQNGELLELLVRNSFDLLITFDKNIRHQQNFSKFPIPVILLIAPDNSYLTLKTLIPNIIKLLTLELQPGINEVLYE